jgi:zinc transport system substrate-binding protein
MKLFIVLISLLSFSFAKTNIVVSIVPQKLFVKSIGGDRVDVSVMVKPGSDPHSYEPKVSQMISLSKADIYFAVGIEFEGAWLSRFANQNSSMKIVDISNGISKTKMPHHSHSGDSHHSHAHNVGDEMVLDTHSWTSPSSVKIMAKNIYHTLVKFDKKNRSFYRKNYLKFIKHINETDLKVREILSGVEVGAKFMVFHPAWGYFAREYGLTQISIEVDGKEPKPSMLKKVIDQANQEGVKAIFTQPEFSDKSAKVVAKELRIQVVKMTPLNPKWSENLIKMAKAVANR